MKILKANFVLFLAALFCISLASCGGAGGGTGGSGDVNFDKIESNLNKKFGDDAHYTNLSIAHVNNIGTIINTTVTDDPASLKLGEYTRLKGAWEQKADVTLELGSGTAEDFMFNLTEDVSLTTLSELVDTSKKKLADEKDLADAHLKLAVLNVPNRGTKADMKYNIVLEPKNGGTSFNFTYTLDGTLDNFSY